MKLNKKKNQLYKKLRIIKEEKCPDCYGKGFYEGDNIYEDNYICEECNGEGIILTNYSEYEK